MKIYWLEQELGDVPHNHDWLCANEQARASAMRVPKRLADWRLGRWTAKNAVAAYLNLPRSLQRLADIEIRALESGAPEARLANAPATVSIALTHRAGVAMCALTEPGAMLGCDLELVEPRSDAFLADYYTDKEQDILRAASGAERDRIANLLWSAKESALKALREGLRLNPLSLSVHLPDRPLGEIAHENIGAQFAAGTDQTGDWQPLQVTWAGGRIFPGWWCQTGAMLRTLVAFPAPEQPKPFSRSTGCNASGLPAERLYHATS